MAKDQGTIVSISQRTDLNVNSFLQCISLLTLPMTRLISSKAQGCKDVSKPSKSCHFGIHGKALAEHSQMSTHMLGFHEYFRFLRHYALDKLATSSIRAVI